MWLRACTLAVAIVGVTSILGCRQSGRDDATQSNAPAAASKTDASPEGLDEARHNIARLKKQLKTKSPEELIALFIPPGGQRYGGYDYYYGFMANAAIREELRSRGAAARETLERHANDGTRLFEGMNGPGDTVGRVCRQLIEDFGNAGTRPAT